MSRRRALAASCGVPWLPYRKLPLWTSLDYSDPANTFYANASRKQFALVNDASGRGNRGQTYSSDSNTSKGQGTYSAPFSVNGDGSPAAINGLQAAYFGGSQEVYQTTNGLSCTAVTVFAVATLYSGTTANGRLFSVHAANASNDYAQAGTMNLCRSGRDDALNWNFNANYSGAIALPAGYGGGVFLLVFRYDGLNLRMQLNGGGAGFTSASTIGGSPTFNADKVSWGFSAYNTGENWQGFFAYSGVATSYVSDADVARWEGWAADRWGVRSLLPSSHPFKAGPPFAELPTGYAQTDSGLLLPAVGRQRGRRPAFRAAA